MALTPATDKTGFLGPQQCRVAAANAKGAAGCRSRASHTLGSTAGVSFSRSEVRPLKMSLKEVKKTPDIAPSLLSNASGEVSSVVQPSAAATPGTSSSGHPP